MPLSDLQTDVLRLLARHRNPESYIAGAAALNRDGPRYSADIDVFHDREDSVARAMPAGKEGLVFLRDGLAVQPDPARLDAYTEHAGRRRGHWPTSPAIGSAMLDPPR